LHFCPINRVVYPDLSPLAGIVILSWDGLGA
jgi:hypothetical protein